MTDEQREINRINGAMGGPKTPEGRAICAQNARRHSLTGQKIILNTEEQPLFDAMTTGYMDLLQPINLEEVDLVREIVSGKWRQDRWQCIEAAMIDLTIQKVGPEIDKKFTEIDPEARAAYAMMQEHGALKAMGLVSLYETRMRRLHERARRDLDRLQAARIPKETKIPKRTQLAPVPEVDPPEPISFRSFISEEELARLDKGKNRPFGGLDLPETDPLDRPKGPKAA
jgi:hypothetical protein